MSYVDEPDRVRIALSPLRRRLLNLLHEPRSASQLAELLDLPRQRVSYHLRLLERAGLVELVEERQRRGCTERILRASASAFVVDPDVMTADENREFTAIHDQFAAEHLVNVAASTVRDVARMQAAADTGGKRLLTFTIEAEVKFAEPGDLHRFTEALTDAVRTTIEAFDSPDGRPYRLVAGGHPAPKSPTNPTGEKT